MWVRCAYLEGDVDPSNRKEFDRCMIDEVILQMAEFPGCREVRVLFGREYEDGVPGFYLVLEHYYDSLKDIHTAITSANRERVWDRLNKVMPLFEGKVTHLNVEVYNVSAGPSPA